MEAGRAELEVEVPFIPIVCAAPLLLAAKRGLFEKNGVRVRLKPVSGWSAIENLIMYNKADVAHMLGPMPFASFLGLDGKPSGVRILAIQNINGQAITIARRHAGIQNPSQMKGFVFGVPYLFSMQFYLLCDYLAKHGVNPLRDVSIREIAPPLMPSYMERGEVDGVLAPEPFNEIIFEQGTGYLFALSRDLWPGHPCCAFVASHRFAEEHPGALKSLVGGIAMAQHALHSASPAERRAMAREIVELGYWHPAQAPAIENALAGHVIDGLGGERDVPDRVDFFPHVRPSLAVWLLSQMQRWGQLAGPVDYEKIASEILSPDVADAAAAAAGFSGQPPAMRGLEPLSARNAMEIMLGQPFCAFRPEPVAATSYDLPDAARARLSQILSELAEVGGGKSELALEITSQCELGWLERMLNHVVRNLRFAREGLRDAAAVAERVERQEAVIAAQEALIRELSTPILPVLDGVLVAPIVGCIDDARAGRILEALLNAVSRERARTVLLDMTGVPSMDIGIGERLLGVVRAISLLGAECILVGLSPQIAGILAESGVDLAGLRTLRDLRTGIEGLRRSAEQSGAFRL